MDSGDATAQAGAEGVWRDECPRKQKAKEKQKHGYIGPGGVAQLRQYQYRGVDHSLLSRFILQPFWSRVVLLVPLSVAPNAVTLAGFLCIVLCYAISWAVCPTTLEPLHHALASLFALLLFLYQTLDAIDGKQARRTGASSPLGELFDHGCDALVATMEVLPFSAVLCLGPQRALVGWLCSASTFFMATWENFHTHLLRLPILNGPTEGLFLIYCIIASVGITGPDPWHLPIPVPRPLLALLPASSDSTIPLIDILLAGFLFLGVLPTVASNVLVVLEVRDRRAGAEAPAQAGSQEKGTLGKATSAVGAGAGAEQPSPVPWLLHTALPFWALSFCVCIWALNPVAGFQRQHPHWFFLPPTFSLGLMAGRLILAHLTREEEGLLRAMWQPLLLQPLALLNLSLELAGLPHLPQELPFAALLLHTGFLYTHFVLGVTHEMCKELQIHCLRLGKRKAS